MIDRRDVLRGALAGAALVACGSTRPVPAPAPARSRREEDDPGPRRHRLPRPQDVEAALASGHTVTMFNRGKREKLQPLDCRSSSSTAIAIPICTADDTPRQARRASSSSPARWDAGDHISGYVPRHRRSVGGAARAERQALRLHLDHLGLRREPCATAATRTRRSRARRSDRRDDGIEFENYGGLKALCERAAAEALPGRVVDVRPGLIVGPGDPTDRFTYWPSRIAAAARCSRRATPDDPLQWIDVRDLAEWLVHLVETGTTGRSTRSAPAQPARWGDVLDTCVRASGSGAKLVWIPQDFLAQHGLGGEDAFPIWAAPVGKTAGMHRWSNERAKAAGLSSARSTTPCSAILAWFPGELERRERVTQELDGSGEGEGSATA